METRRRSRRFDRRKTVRRSRPSPALVRSHRLKGDRSENAFIQEMSSKGMRVTSGIPLMEKDRVVLYIGEEKKPVVAQVVWARKEGIIEKRMTGKPGQAFVAGCTFVRESPKKPRKKKAAPVRISRKGSEYSARLIRILLIGGGLAMLAIGINIVFSLFSILGSSGG